MFRLERAQALRPAPASASPLLTFTPSPAPLPPPHPRDSEAEEENEDAHERVERAVSNAEDNYPDDDGDDDLNQEDDDAGMATPPPTAPNSDVEEGDYQDYDIANVENRMNSTGQERRGERHQKADRYDVVGAEQSQGMEEEDDDEEADRYDLAGNVGNSEREDKEDDSYNVVGNVTSSHDRDPDVASDENPTIHEGGDEQENGGESEDQLPLANRPSWIQRERKPKRKAESPPPLDQQPQAKRQRWLQLERKAKRKAESLPLDQQPQAKRLERKAAKRKAELTEERWEEEEEDTEPPAKRAALAGHTCQVCGNAFSSSLALTAHFYKKHQPLVNLPTTVDGHRLKPPAKRHTCQLCHESFSSSVGLNRHIMTRHQPTVNMSNHKHLMKKIQKELKRLQHKPPPPPSSKNVVLKIANDKNLRNIKNLPESEFARYGVQRLPSQKSGQTKVANRKRKRDGDDVGGVRQSERLKKKRENSPTAQSFQNLVNHYRRDKSNYEDEFF